MSILPPLLLEGCRFLCRGSRGEYLCLVVLGVNSFVVCFPG